MVAVTSAGNLVQQSDNHISKFKLGILTAVLGSLSIESADNVLRMNWREIFETIKCSLFIHPLPFYTCKVTPSQGENGHDSLEGEPGGHDSCRTGSCRLVMWSHCFVL
jgi:hypothetical protein